MNNEFIITVLLVGVAVFTALHIREGWKNYKDSRMYAEDGKQVFAELFQSVSLRDATTVGVDVFLLVGLGVWYVYPTLANNVYWTTGLVGLFLIGRAILYVEQRGILARDVNLLRRDRLLRYGYIASAVIGAVSVASLLFFAAQPDPPTLEYFETEVEPVTPQVRAGEFLILPVRGNTQSEIVFNDIVRTIRCNTVIEVTEDLSYRYFYEQPFITSGSGPSIPAEGAEPSDFDFNLGVLIPEDAPAGQCVYHHGVVQAESTLVGFRVPFEIIEGE